LKTENPYKLLKEYKEEKLEMTIQVNTRASFFSTHSPIMTSSTEKMQVSRSLSKQTIFLQKQLKLMTETLADPPTGRITTTYYCTCSVLSTHCIIIIPCDIFVVLLYREIIIALNAGTAQSV
jgi:hypothetical protein